MLLKIGATISPHAETNNQAKNPTSFRSFLFSLRNRGNYICLFLTKHPCAYLQENKKALYSLITFPEIPRLF